MYSILSSGAQGTWFCFPWNFYVGKTSCLLRRWEVFFFPFPQLCPEQRGERNYSIDFRVSKGYFMRQLNFLWCFNIISKTIKTLKRRFFFNLMFSVADFCSFSDFDLKRRRNTYRWWKYIFVPELICCWYGCFGFFFFSSQISLFLEFQIPALVTYVFSCKDLTPA